MCRHLPKDQHDAPFVAGHAGKVWLQLPAVFMAASSSSGHVTKAHHGLIRRVDQADLKDQENAEKNMDKFKLSSMLPGGLRQYKLRGRHAGIIALGKIYPQGSG